MAAYALPATLSPTERLMFKVPFLGRMAKEISYGDRNNVYYAIGGFLSGWACLVLLFGLPGLYLPALALVPVMWTLLIMISRG